MIITAKVVADSVHYLAGRRNPRRLTSFVLRFPRYALPELGTHRFLSKNTASSRALPIEKVIQEVTGDPATFVYWGRNMKGMSAAEELAPDQIDEALSVWLTARDSAVASAKRLSALGLHKQNVNRLLEPWCYTTVLCTATDYANFYALRRHKDAMPEMKGLADAMFSAQQASTPVDRTDSKGIDRWHLPLVREEERHSLMSAAIKVCVGRCARVSYLTFDGRLDFNADVALHDRLLTSGHFSPFEHPSLPFRQPFWKRWTGHSDRSGNLHGWAQYRKSLAFEHPYTPGQVEP